MTNFKFYRTGKAVIERFPVSAKLKDWNIEWKDYKPVPVIIDFGQKPWADPDIKDVNFHPKWNELDANIDRRSHCGKYSIDKDGFPLNPTGRTGVMMRGLLGRWGPNHAADPIVTRWKRDDSNKIIKHKVSGKPIMQFVAIQRKDVLEWAIPGGMVDPGETVPETLKREFFEESLNSMELSSSELDKMNDRLKKFFTHGQTIFKGYVNDPRNTDNAWIETVAVNFHDDQGDMLNSLSLKAGDDARNVRWMDIDRETKLYANHLDFIETTVRNKCGHW
ncbi:LOW QUALITY PROTEIN: ADP-ribose pyrophosphatase, mitochondrial [Dermatophagoides pteronyssinus]|uniref:LOW QUALITY PROTEIN: ADP-ribose pyrophosphatase, mitochondrial n=1 Tax=Dermatophagoides pteronyssinus TaxID=6956 RepID=UPI003F67F237